MTGETWASIITTVVVPIVLRVLVHYFPWLADAVTPGAQPTKTAPSAPETPGDPSTPGSAEGA